MLAIMFLPRQFQIAVVENVNENHLDKAIWLFPLYMLAMNLFVVPVAFGGVLHFGATPADPDTFVLTLPMAQRQEALALLVFIGGLSAATGMVIVETVALSTMICNDLVVPILHRFVWGRLPSDAELSAYLIQRTARQKGGHWLDFASRRDFMAAGGRSHSFLELVDRCDSVELWMGTRPNDQLVLIWLLDYLRHHAEIATKIVHRAQDHGLRPEDIIIDPLALTIAADPSAVRVTLQTMRLIHDELGVNMVCGAGNISFGLPERPPLTGAYLSMGMLNGLTCAITDVTNETIRMAVKASDVLLGHDEYAVSWIADFRERQRARAGSQIKT